MIGWERVASRDYAELVENGHVDDDLERMKETVERRMLARNHPICPECGEPVRGIHNHGRIVIVEKDIKKGAARTMERVGARILSAEERMGKRLSDLFDKDPS